MDSELDLDLEDLKIVYDALLYFQGGSISKGDRGERLKELILIFGNSILEVMTDESI